MLSSRPFTPSFGNRPSQLVGRGSLLEEIAQGLRTEPGTRDRSVVLLGQRGTSKTVLLWEIADRARALGFVVANPTTSSEDSPYLMQLVGHYLTRYARANKVDEAALSDAIRAAKADYERDVCETSLAALSAKDNAFLAAMAQDDGPSRVSDVATRLGVTTDYAQKYRRRLLDAGIIRVAARGEVAFAVPYLQDWLRRRSR